jgi:DNA-binding NarL/FixJ family response regulator
MTAVLVVEDQQALASALEVAIGIQPDLECVGTAGTVQDALDQIARRAPDVVLMDIELPGADGIEGTRRIKAAYPHVSVLILTAGATSARLAAAAAAGAAGFLTKDTGLPDILAAIRNPVDGKLVIEGTTLSELLDDLRDGDQAQPAGGSRRQPAGEPYRARLTAREQEVLALMGEGLDPRSIADQLVLSLYTARGHVKNIMMKLGAHSQLEAVVVATKSGLLQARVPPPRGETA